MIFKKKSILFFLLVIFLFSLNLSNSKAFAEQNKFTPTCEIKETNISCFNLQSDQDFTVQLYNEPYRIQFTFANKLIFKKNKVYKEKFISDVRFNQKLKSSTKLVLEFKNATIISDVIYKKVNKKSIDLILNFSNTSVVNYAIAKHVLKKNNGNIFSLENEINILSNKVQNPLKKKIFPKNKQQNLTKTKLNKNYIIFIDPGHGGRDPGAIGQLGTLEKDVTLKTSLLLAKALKTNKKFVPILSRDKDIYLSLRKRTMLAKKNNADIFISIHADSSKNKKARGISVFSLSDKASDKEAQLLAQRENEVDNLLGEKEKIVDPLIYGTLIKMFQREAMNDSSNLAKNILSNLEKTKLAVNRGHRFAGFSVLKSYNIPSVLIEIGFLSNKQEEKKLLNSRYLNELSRGLAIAIHNYFNKHEK